MQHRSFSHFRELLWGMTEKELRARYKHTIFGFLWIVVNPLLQMLIIGFVFPLFVKQTVRNYPFYLLTGLLAWNFFSLSLNKATSVLVNERSLIKKSVFPRVVIPLSVILSNFIHIATAFVPYIILVSLLGMAKPERLPLFFAGLVMLVIFTTGLSLLTSALNVRFRDVAFFVQAITIVWFYATPVVYSLSQIPQKLLWIWRINPVTAPIQLMQHALAGSIAPGPAMIAANTAVILAVTAVGIFVFFRESPDFDDWL